MQVVVTQRLRQTKEISPRDDGNKPRDANGKVKRSSFEKWIEPDLEKTRECVERLLHKTGLDARDVDWVFLTGGSSLVPAVRKIFEDRFDAQRISGGCEFTSVAKGPALAR